ncbi:hypothetical protein INT46_001906 [Mucor plumbeus]|uniref:Uncharacterized protein n=1 Tax=Mucor plumbeus TaxID=97098 RepID=A0A8H7RI38_9FUNG|nr:hypothetical protein INT46_001906 [Mucor plumbeus]
MSKKSESTAAVTIRKRKISSSETSSTSTTKKASSSGKSTNALSDSRKWKLEDGVYAEDLLYDYAKSRKNKNLSHFKDFYFGKIFGLCFIKACNLVYV